MPVKSKHTDWWVFETFDDPSSVKLAAEGYNTSENMFNPVLASYPNYLDLK